MLCIVLTPIVLWMLFWVIVAIAEICRSFPQALCVLALLVLLALAIPWLDKIDPPTEIRLDPAIPMAVFSVIITAGEGEIGGAMQPLPSGLWGMPADMMKTLPGYDPDIQKNRAQARKIMEKLGYGPDKRLGITVSTRNIAGYRDPAVILMDQLKEIYFDAQLETLDTTQWYPKITRRDYKVGVNVTETAVDDPDPVFYENYVCGTQRNYTGYCNPEVDKMVDAQSMESNVEKRKRMVWDIEKKLVEDDARPTIFYPRTSHCWQPRLKGMTVMANSIYNGHRVEDLWLDD
jgi:peptide/nickel transport system substrate-binding protein